MGIILFDREKAGFARYCPTFAKAFGCLAEGIARRRRKSELLALAREKRIDRIHAALRSEPGRLLLGELVNHRDDSVGTAACWAVRTAAESGMDMASMVPSLLKALRARGHLYRRIDSALALREIASSADSALRLDIANSIARQASELLPGTLKADPGASTTLLDTLDLVLEEMVRRDGVYPIALARLRRIRASMEGAEQARANP